MQIAPAPTVRTPSTKRQKKNARPLPLQTAALSLACLTLLPFPLHGAIVLPAALASVEGNTGMDRPFDRPAMRYQQAYAASQFASLGGPRYITQIAFRPDAASGNAFSSTLSDIQINMATTVADPDGLSAVFANNTIVNDTVVYARGPLTLSSSDTGPVGAPRNFDIVINLTTPFLYNPAIGNLVMDVRNFGGGTTTLFDGEFAFADGIGSVFNNNGVDQVSGIVDRTGLVTAFTFAPVPEPSTYIAGVLLLLPVCATTVRFLRKPRRDDVAASLE